MDQQVPFALRGRNPDVLTCIANLSNDEVFTPPEFANRMLDSVAEAWAAANNGADIWADSSVKFLDPFAKSGVFLRAITRRLTDGLASEFPDLEERVDHILTKQVFGIAITNLTSLLARRSVYCSKQANGSHSIARSFNSETGNIWFEPMEHTWDGAKCKFCNAPRAIFHREDGLESHAYAFIHTDDIAARIAELFGGDMQFDVIIGNPPYQMTGGGGGTNDSPIYQLFVEQAVRLEPKFLCMVIPSRWMAGGRGLGEFRAEFLGDQRLRTLVDYENAKDAFPTVGIGGGICYFLWNRDNPGPCECTYHRNGAVIGPYPRALDEFDVFVRDKRAVDILQKVVAAGERSFEELVSGDTPFGLPTNFSDYKRDAVPNDTQVLLYANVATKRVRGAMSRGAINKNQQLIDVWKLFLPVAGSGRERERSGVDIVLGPPIIGEPGSVCTQTYLVAGPLASKIEAESVQSYLRTRLARFLVSLRKPAQHVFRGMYRWVPVQTWDRTWTDADLYKKYGIADSEIAFIEQMIRPMGAGDE
ncbi:Eco57I restriction-modification methylase domain-containing protein [Aminobacter ciceronei]|uniref:site-specific DNA-methyltransferase (adenine-specific) n=1 Tax=Aminobacter ciceronei TaxID=150723 RepID=A0ABR6CAX0_9HYPH|nr:Eco57I restriction-modification methylase domain-containing protein [Aminobacter ciceronei]MBA8908023.1 site-specific DNA-methyltransferase (adenine-specific) [Aminobacter ciceronei]MBA9021778.1 site-specific DNA-methyltransferase (adenine-specific) [Aminobacter ciceronei]